MAQLEQLTRGATVKGILPDALITVVDVQWHGNVAITLTYRDAAGRLGNEILYRDSEPGIEIVTVGLPWSFDGDGTTQAPAAPISLQPHRFYGSVTLDTTLALRDTISVIEEVAKH
jgi:hypothetical protein